MKPSRKIGFLRLLTVLTCLALLAVPAVLAESGAPATPQATTPSGGGPVGVDSSSQWQANMQALEAKWDADKAAAGIRSDGKDGPSNKLAQAALSQVPSNYHCLPTCNETDARFLSLAGTGASTLAGDTIALEVAAPQSATSLEIGVFDGDTSGAWDQGDNTTPWVPSEYTLLADPAGDGSGTGGQIGQWLGNVMPDNAWYTIPIALTSAAQAPSGNYFYVLKVRNTDPVRFSSNSFKVGTTGILTAKPSAFAFMGAVGNDPSLKVVYPSYPSLSPTTYDGTWHFYLDVPEPTPFFAVWDGDLDYGSYDLSTKDTDDQDTPDNILPPWTAGTPATFEGIAVGYSGATGAPADDYSVDFYRRSPSVTYEVVDPAGNHYLNSNPSGNLEWEQFRIDSSASVPADYHVATTLPSGVYTVNMSGMDLSNLNAWRFSYDVLCVDTAGNPCTPLRPYLVGDTVWYDANSDGQQALDGSEPGLAGVVMNLLDSSGKVLATTTTDANGNYYFPVQGQRIDSVLGSDGLFHQVVVIDGKYTVQVDDGNFDTGGVLDGLTATTASPTQTNTVINANVLTYDFGYVGTIGQSAGEIGNEVWLDTNGNGVYEPLLGETGIAGVTLALSRYVNGIWIPVETTVSGGDGSGCGTPPPPGNYCFDLLPDGTYQVSVVAASVPAGLVSTTPSSIVDQDNYSKSPNGYVTTLVNGIAANEYYADFGYKSMTTHKIGNLVWIDCDGDGVYDGAAVAGIDCTCVEAGVSGVTINLLDTAGHVLATTTTAANGTYYFTGLPVGTYVVDVTDVYHKLSGYVHTLGDQSQNVDNTSKADPYTVVLKGTDVLTADFGYTQKTGTIGNQVWKDSDGDGIFDYGELGISGVTVKLYWDAANDGGYGTLVGTTTTNSSGQYWFYGLAAGKYKVQVVDGTGTPLAGMIHTLGNQSQTSDGTSKANPYYPLALGQGQTVQTADFGYKYSGGSIGNLVWLDCNGNGVYNPSTQAQAKPDATIDCYSTCVEKGISGVTLKLYYDSNNDGSYETLIGTQTTDASGIYWFRNLPDGKYLVDVTDAAGKLSGMVHTLGNQSVTVDNNSKADPYRVQLTGGQTISTVDFGYKQATGAPGTGTPGFWKNHSSAWPVSEIVIGGHIYSKAQAITWLGTAVNGDKTITMFAQLVSAKLNAIAGNNYSCVSQTIADADAWMAAHPVGSGVSGNSSAWTQAAAWATTLDSYNNGHMCAPHRN